MSAVLVTPPTVLDASAVLAFLQEEPGHDMVRQALQAQRCIVTAANQAEIITKALDKGMGQDEITSILADLGYEVADIKAEDGTRAGSMRPATRALGLSLGDRLCLAVAQRLKASVLTADRPWLAASEALGIAVACLRPDSH